MTANNLSLRSLRLFDRILNKTNDYLLNISTGGTQSVNRPGSVYYATNAYSHIRDTLKRLKLVPEDTFVDVGSGKGRVVCLAAQYKIQLAVGVEYSTELALQARRNAKRLRRSASSILICNSTAEQFDYSTATALYFFNPFKAHVLDRVLRKIRADRHGKPVRMAFIMESDHQRSVFAAHPWLMCTQRWSNRSGLRNALYRTHEPSNPESDWAVSSPMIKSH